MDELSEIGEQLLAMERAALDRWGQGDPSGYLEISDEAATYFDPFLEKRIEGRQALTAYYESIRGQVHIDRDEIVEPRVQVAGDVGVLTFRFHSRSGTLTARWNCTEVYTRRDGRWLLTHTHWALNSRNGEPW